jgi:hypothetical protein
VEVHWRKQPRLAAVYWLMKVPVVVVISWAERRVVEVTKS